MLYQAGNQTSPLITFTLWPQCFSQKINFFFVLTHGCFACVSRFYGPWISSAFIFLLWLGILALILWFQRQVLQAETDKEKVETEILRHAEKTNMLQVQVDNAQKDKENLQNEMEILLDRINKLSELVDKSRVNICRTAKFVERECISLLSCYHTCYCTHL